MATSSLLDSFRDLAPELTPRVSSLLGESETSVSKAFGGLLPLLGAAAARKAAEPRGIEPLYGLIDDPANDRASILANASSLLADGGSQGALGSLASRLLALLFGDRTSGLASALASFAGIRPSSGSKLLSLGAPLLLSLLRDRARTEGAGAAGLARWLAGQRGALDAGVPAGLARVLEEPARRVATPAPPIHTAHRAGNRWLWPLLALLLLVGLWALLRSREEPTVPQAATAPPVAAPPPARTAAMVRRTLPNGVALEIPESGLEEDLIVFLGDPSRPLDERTWWNFDRLLFETDSAVLEPESRAQLSDVAVILKAYPSARLKIGGYTDNQGDPSYNLRLSQDRATNVMRELVALGIAADRLEAEGYGEQYPVASNDTEAGRQQNRRIALRVTQR